ncbi:filamentous hemagglutinin N-terminal domain-containing protein [Pseudanabaena biceps]|nr:filamentous hemagglutinin N-terminal domain-containing protein [Pseudanabaena biceps]NUN67683.1 filamentous hemagglutinin N-terminal domain-containing protein [Pseudanabaena biceps]
MFISFQDCLKTLSVLSLANLLIADHVLAQILPDQTTGTQVIPNLIIQGLSSDLVQAGTLRGANLFHSFLELNVASDRGLYFSNPASVSNIFARVTGANPSNILGRLGVLGNANLFLLNPNGVLFGENSSLAIAGSLYVSTSDQLRFADGTTFSTNNPESSALLTSSIPVGLGFGTNSGVNAGGITVRSQSEPLTPLPLPLEVTQVIRKPAGLILSPNSTIALIGSAVNLENQGSLFVLGGAIELGGVRSGEVSLIANGQKFAIAYPNVSQFGNVKISGEASVNNIGLQQGDIQIVGDQVSLLNNGLVLSSSLGEQFSGKISIQAQQLIELVGSNNYAQSVLELTSNSPNLAEINGLISFGAGTSNGGDIQLNAPNLNVSNSSFIVSSILQNGRAGNIEITVPQSLTLDAGAIFSGTAATATGLSGDIEIQTGKLFIQNNAAISSSSLGLGKVGGDILINATRSLEIVGNQPIFSTQNIVISGGIFTTTRSNASAGNINVTTPLLSISNGGVLTTETQGSGNGGTVTVNSDRLEISGLDPSNQLPSAILAVARQGTTGDGGNINLTSKIINIQNGATVNVANLGIGNAGNLQIVADNLFLNQQSSLLASSILGEGGNISLQISDRLLLRNNSHISASSQGNGNSGNIQINSGLLLGVEDSQINANAFGGNGGNILINTQGLFFAPNQITASSILGLSGNVAISTLEISPKNTFVSSVDNFVQVDAIVANSCLARRNAMQGSFVVTGSGGLSKSPYDLIVAEYAASEILPLRDSDNSMHEAKPTSAQVNLSNPNNKKSWEIGDPIVEVKDLARAKNGAILPVITYADANALGCFKK